MPHLLRKYSERLAVQSALQPVATFSCFLVSLLISGVIVGTTTQVFGRESTPYDWRSTDAPAVENADAHSWAISTANEVKAEAAGGNASAVAAVQTERWSRTSFSIVYKLPDGACTASRGLGVFEPSFLQGMCKREKDIIDSPYWQQLCLKADSSGSGCDIANPAHLSAVQFAYGTTDPYSAGCPLLTEQEITDRMKQAKASLATPAGAFITGFYLDINGHKSAEEGEFPSPCMTRSVLPGGRPLAGDPSIEDRNKAQDIVVEWEPILFKSMGLGERTLMASPVTDAVIGVGASGEMRFFMQALQAYEFANVSTSDASFAGFSMIIVFIILRIQLKSTWKSAMGMLVVLLCLFPALIFFWHILQVHLFDTLNTLVIFLLLGIGADNLLVFDASLHHTKELLHMDANGDAYEHGPHAGSLHDGEVDVFQKIPAGTLRKEARALAFAINKTAHAVAITSGTTAIAFFATSISPLAPIRSFGYIAALSVISLYLLSISFVPTIWMLHMRYPKLRGCSRKTQAEALEHDLQARDLTPREAHDKKAADRVAQGLGSVQIHGPDAKFDAWIEGKFAPAMVRGNKTFSVLSFLAVAGVFIGFATQAVQLQPPSEPEEWFPSTHMYQMTLSQMGEFVADETESYSIIYITSGLGEMQRPDYNQWYPDEKRGYPKLVPVGLSPVDRLAHKAACAKLEANFDCPSDVDACEINNGQLVLPDTLLCPLRDFEQILMAQSPGLTESAIDAMPEETYRESLYQYWTAYGDTSLLGFDADGELLYLSVGFRAPIKGAANLSKKEPLTAFLEEVADGIKTNEYSGSSLANSVMLTADDQLFWWMPSEQALVSGLFQGLAISFPACFLVLSLATGNVIVSLYAVSSIGGIVLTVLGVAKLAGWGLGIAESIAGVIVVGFSVDYTAHLGAAYQEAHALSSTKTRSDKYIIGMATMGSVVIGGGLTTAGAGAVLLFTTMSFFKKMSILMCSTIITSMVASWFFFMPGLAMFGPGPENRGDIHKLLRAVGVSEAEAEDVGKRRPSMDDVEKRDSKKHAPTAVSPSHEKVDTE